jgi:hypothetical protein
MWEIPDYHLSAVHTRLVARPPPVSSHLHVSGRKPR